MNRIIVLCMVAIGCGDDKQPPGQLREQDQAPFVERAIDGAAGMSLRFTRTRGDGWRQVDVKIGDKIYAFHNDALRFMLDANGEGFGNRAVVCGMATPDSHDGTNMSVTCAIAEPSGLGARHDITSPTSAWLADVCIDGDQVTLLHFTGLHPFGPDTSPCRADTWRPSTGWDGAATLSSACSCELRDGVPCSDPCFVGMGVIKDAVCDTSGLAPACDDGDATTHDFCTGKVDELCYSVPTQ